MRIGVLVLSLPRDLNSFSISKIEGGHSVTLAMAFARRAQSARPAGKAPVWFRMVQFFRY